MLILVRFELLKASAPILVTLLVDSKVTVLILLPSNAPSPIDTTGIDTSPSSSTSTRGISTLVISLVIPVMDQPPCTVVT